MMYFEEATRVLIANKMRTFLTTIGLIIGVFAVISIEVLGHSMAGSISETLGALADNSFVVFPGSFQGNFARASMRISDLSNIVATVPNVASGVPLGGQRELVRYGHNVGRFTLSSDSNPPFANLPLAYGRYLSDDDIANASDVGVLSWRAYQRLFPDGGDPSGDSIYAGTHRYVVVGVLAQATPGPGQRTASAVTSRSRTAPTSANTSTATASSPRVSPSATRRTSLQPRSR